MANITKEKRNWMIGSGIIIALLIAFFGAVYWLFFYTGSTKEIVAVADQLQVDPSWKLDMEVIEPERTICIDVECPSVSRSWKTNQPIERSDLEQILENSGWKNVRIENNCSRERRSGGSPISYCIARGSVEKYEIYLSAAGSTATPDQYQLRLGITERK